MVAEDITEPLPAVGGPGLELPAQIARFGDLAGRDLAGRDLAARGGALDCEPLNASERLEMLALRAAITGGSRTADPPGTADALRSGSPQVLHRPARLWRPPPPPGPRRGSARHRRIADNSPS